MKGSVSQFVKLHDRVEPRLKGAVLSDVILCCSDNMIIIKFDIIYYAYILLYAYNIMLIYICLYWRQLDFLL